MGENSHPHVHREEATQLLNRLKRIEGQIRGIHRMIEEDQYCVDILNQVSAARAALGKLGVILLETHTRGCVVHAVRDEEDADSVKELMEVIKRFI